MPVVTESPTHRTVQVQLGERSYPIHVGADLISGCAPLISEWLGSRFSKTKVQKTLVITDSNVRPIANKVLAELEQAGWATRCFEMAAGENSKKISVIAHAWDQLVDMQADRQTVVIAVGGGVVGDAAGFVAATFARGVPFVQIPTTLLSDVDSSVGGKVGINHPLAKNLIGAFHQPIGVLIDTDSLNSLPDREYRSGLAEVVKYGVILDAPFFEFLEQNVEALNQRDKNAVAQAISRSCELKAIVVEQDEQELTGLRAVLNYGHTFAHAFEALTGYGELLHGEAVSIGMVYASQLSERLGRTDAAFTERQVKLLQALHLPVQLSNPAGLQISDVLHRMQLDKKTLAGELRFVLPTKMGHVELVTGVPVSDVEAVLKMNGL